jgi:hypothetical protein
MEDRMHVLTTFEVDVSTLVDEGTPSPTEEELREIIESGLAEGDHVEPQAAVRRT